MNIKSDMPVRHGRLIRWAIGVTLAGALAGGGIAMALGDSSASAAGQAASNAQLNALLSASGASASGAALSGTSAATGPGAGLGRVRALRRLHVLGGMYGSFTFRTKSGDETLAFERGTIESVGSSDIVVRAADGTTMTWLFVSDTVVRDHGKSSTSDLSDGQLIFVGGPVTSGARDARLIVVRTGGSGTAAGRTTSLS